MKIATLAFAAAAFAVTNCANATIFSVGTEGTVHSGTDTLGIFSNPGTKLDGLPYSLTVSFDLDETAQYHRDPSRYTSASAAVPFIVALAVGAYNYAFEVTDNLHEYVQITNELSTNQGTVDAVSAGATGTDWAGRPVRVNQFFTTYGIRSNSLTQYLQMRTDDTMVATFQIGNGTSSTGFNVYGPVIFTVNGTPAALPAPEPIPDPTPVPDPHPVPEPASAMLFGAGLLGFAVLRHRRFRRY